MLPWFNQYLFMNVEHCKIVVICRSSLITPHAILQRQMHFDIQYFFLHKYLNSLWAEAEIGNFTHGSNSDTVYFRIVVRANGFFVCFRVLTNKIASLPQWKMPGWCYFSQGDCTKDSFTVKNPLSVSDSISET